MSAAENIPAQEKLYIQSLSDKLVTFPLTSDSIFINPTHTRAAISAFTARSLPPTFYYIHSIENAPLANGVSSFPWLY